MQIADKVTLDDLILQVDAYPVHCANQNRHRTGTEPGTLVLYMFLSTVWCSVLALKSRLTIINWFIMIN